MGTTKTAGRCSSRQDAVHIKDNSQSPLKAGEKHSVFVALQNVVRVAPTKVQEEVWETSNTLFPGRCIRTLVMGFRNSVVVQLDRKSVV